MKIGYVRVSTQEQHTIRQEEMMETLAVDKVYIDKASGKDMDRPALQEMMNFVREGDLVVTESISRFARNTKDLLGLVEQLHQKKVGFVSQKESIDTDTPAGKFMLTVFGAVAELEREYIRQRQKEGIEIAKRQGKYKGRPAKELKGFGCIHAEWKAGKITAAYASRQLGISRSTFYRKAAGHGNKGTAGQGDSSAEICGYKERSPCQKGRIKDGIAPSSSLGGDGQQTIPKEG